MTKIHRTVLRVALSKVFWTDFRCDTCLEAPNPLCQHLCPHATKVNERVLQTRHSILQVKSHITLKYRVDPTAQNYYKHSHSMLKTAVVVYSKPKPITYIQTEQTFDQLTVVRNLVFGRTDSVQFHGLAILSQLKSRCRYTIYPIQLMLVTHSNLFRHLRALSKNKYTEKN